MPKRLDFADTLYNAKWLEKKYRTMSTGEIAELLGCTYGAVIDNLRKHGIPVVRGKNARHVGSHAPRPRKRFLSTLHNAEWLKARYVDENRSASEVAFLAGASIPSTIRALRVAGIEVRGIGEAKQGKPNPKRRVVDPTIVASRARARAKTPPGPCVFCGGEGDNINHKDRDPHNNDESNLERLCVMCHRRQHAMEERVMIEWLRARGVAYIEIHAEARTRLENGEFERKK